ncbi:MAG: SRPBCC domain-containing protein [Actinomycetota bacterium]|nr:SRPBCC domain-containing protein [Actinomycetota bacterium]
MRVAGEHDFTAPRRTVWHVLNDPSSMAATMPGIESFDVKDDRHWRANVKIPLGLGGLKMSVDFTKLEEREPEFARLQAKGNGVGAIMNMETQFHLSEAGAGTHMRWEADVNIGGPVGSMGQRVLQPIVNQQVANVLNALEKQVNEAAGSEPKVHTGSEPGGNPMEPGVAETGVAEGGSLGGSGSLGTPPASTDIPPPATDPEVKDAGPPAEGSPTTEPAEGTSGADEGLNPLAPQSYEPKPEGPTTSTED